MAVRERIDEIKKRFLELPLYQRIGIIAGIIGIVMGFLVLILSSKGPVYATLFSNLREEDAARVVEKLEEMKIKYKLKDGGKTILVPADKVYKLRLKLVSQGLPKGGTVGFEIFDKMKFGVTEFVQNLDYVRALQGELARTIMSMDEITYARVHLAIPKKTLFAEEEKKPSASVVVTLKPGATLSREQVRAIVLLVAKSVEGMDPKDVVVVDSRGRVLTKKEDEEEKLTTKQLLLQRMVEKNLENKIVRLLEPVVGPGKVIAKVSAQLNFRKVEMYQELYDPDSISIRSEEVLKETKQNYGVGGVPGVASNVPPGMNKTGRYIYPLYTKEKRITNYEISKTTSKIQEPIGTIERLSISVLVDGTYKKGKNGKMEFVPRSPQELTKIEDLVKKAVGFDPKRGDQIAVSCIPFEVKPEKKPTMKDIILSLVTSKDFIVSVLRYFTIIIVSLLFFLFVVRPFLAWLKEVMAPPPPEELVTVPGAPPAEEVAEEEEKEKGPVERLRDIAAKDAGKLADVITLWASEEEGK